MYSRISQTRRYCLSAAFALFLLTFGGSATALVSFASLPDDEDADEPFEMASNVPENELSDMRGGFYVAGGLQIDFGLTSSTLVDGNVVSNFTLHTNQNVPSQNLQQMLQVGSGNNIAASTPATLGNTVLTIVQNTSNNSLIQNRNVLNLTVSNLANLRNQTVLENSVSPLIRAIH